MKLKKNMAKGLFALIITATIIQLLVSGTLFPSFGISNDFIQGIIRGARFVLILILLGYFVLVLILLGYFGLISSILTRGESIDRKDGGSSKE